MGQAAYPLGATMSVVTAYEIQYFVMGTWFPLGIALFHAANLRFLRVAELQKQFEATRPVRRMRPSEGRCGSRVSWMGRWRNAKYDDKIFALIGMGIVFQVLSCVGMWAACRKYHPDFGVAGSEVTGESLQEQIIDLGRGWEWWPSLL